MQKRSDILQPTILLIGIVSAFVLVLAAFVLGYLAHAWLAPAEPAHPGHAEQESSLRPGLWTCAMHPQIRQPKPGRCPICNMDLIPLEAGQPLRFGADRRSAVVKRSDGLGLTIGRDVAEDSPVVVHDPALEDPTYAFALSRLGDADAIGGLQPAADNLGLWPQSRR